jgi:aminopeptidase N
MEETKNAFKDIPGLIAAAEKLFGPYKWERYDASVLCDAFPYTAMEHGCKSTFGKSCTGQAEQIAHEIIHSWFGNDITNATWFEFFWNEGFTVWGQITVMTSYWDWDCASLVFWKMLKAMEKAIEEYQNTHPGLLSLVSKEAKFSRIPYGKGALFFFMLQDAMGGHDIFLQFVKDYRNVFFQNSMSSERFLAFLKAWLANESDVVNFEEFKANHKIDQWLYEREFPDNRPKVSSDCLELIQKQAEAFLEVGLMDLEAYHNWNEEMRYVFFGELEERSLLSS